MGAVAEGSPSIRAQANLSALGLHEMAASLPDYVRMVAAGERGFASALEEMTRVEVAAREVRITSQRICYRYSEIGQARQRPTAIRATANYPTASPAAPPSRAGIRFH